MSVVSLILAAGKGTRMRSETMSKVMHPLSGHPIIGWVLEAALPFGGAHLVTGHLRQQVESWVSAHYPDVRYSVQTEQNGTGGAVRCAMRDIDPAATRILILPGDAPLVEPLMLERLMEAGDRDRADLALLTADALDPARYGRIIREGSAIRGIVEYNDATEAQRRITEVNGGIYLVTRALLEAALPQLSDRNAKGEYYLTDIVAYAVASGAVVTAHRESGLSSLAGINSRVELAAADALMQRRLKNALMEGGVTMLLPDTIYVERGAVVGPDTTIHPGVYLTADARIGRGCTIPPHTVVRGEVTADAPS